MLDTIANGHNCCNQILKKSNFHYTCFSAVQVQQAGGAHNQDLRQDTQLKARRWKLMLI